MNTILTFNIRECMNGFVVSHSSLDSSKEEYVTLDFVEALSMLEDIIKVFKENHEASLQQW